MMHSLRQKALAAPQPIKQLLKQTDWQLRRLTAAWRVLPTFLIIGAQKGGTTSLYEYLVQHPAIAAARTKEVHYFSRHAHQPDSWYRAQFPSLLQQQAITKQHHIFHTGESTPYYLFHPEIPQRVYRLLPQIKLIAVLRNPVDRAFSHYHHSRRHGYEPLDSFAEAIAAESERLASGDYDDAAYYHHSYLARGRYAEQLARWTAVFPRNQLLILSSEALFTEPQPLFAKLSDFLGLPFWTPPQYKQFNSGRYTDMPDPLCQELTNYFAPHNERLYNEFGVDFRW